MCCLFFSDASAIYFASSWRLNYGNHRYRGPIQNDSLLITSGICEGQECSPLLFEGEVDVPDEIELVVAKHEGGAANMAEADGKLTGRPDILAACAGGLVAQELPGRVVRVADGDTITVLDQSKVQHRIRLAGIDAPERRQPYGARAKDHLSSLVAGRQVVVAWQKRDRYGRIVGKVLLDGRDINLAMVRAGLAWHYKAYALEQAEKDDLTYSGAEDSARQRRTGLWGYPHPMAPWDWRRR
jgi:endonuclease YncB( thermonuclease family)